MKHDLFDRAVIHSLFAITINIAFSSNTFCYLFINREMMQLSSIICFVCVLLLINRFVLVTVESQNNGVIHIGYYTDSQCGVLASVGMKSYGALLQTSGIASGGYTTNDPSCVTANIPTGASGMTAACVKGNIVVTLWQDASCFQSQGGFVSSSNPGTCIQAGTPIDGIGSINITCNSSNHSIENTKICSLLVFLFWFVVRKCL